MRWQLFISIILIGIGTAVNVAEGADIVLNPEKDNTPHKDYDDLCGRSSANEDALGSLDIYTRASLNRISRAVLKFDLNSLSVGTQVSHATLRLWGILQGEYNSNTHNAARITEDWNSPEVTWCDRLTGTTWGMPGVSFTTAGQASVWVPSKFGEDLPPDSNSFPYEEWIEWDLTEIVKEWVEQGQPNYGIVVYQTDLFDHGRNQEFVYASRENENSSLVPQLVIATCPDGGELAACRTMNTSEMLFATRYSKDATNFGLPGDAIFYDSTQVTITKSPGDRFYISGEAGILSEWICDDRLYIDDVYVQPVGFQDILDPAFPLCEPMQNIVGSVAAREVTDYIPDGTHCITFKLADTQREIYGNTEIHLIMDPNPIPIEPTSWGDLKAQYR